jgi:hypothetical protein
VTQLSDAEIVGRVRLSNGWLEKFRLSDIAASNQYIDSNSGSQGADDGWGVGNDETFKTVADVPDVVPIGQPNYMAINTEISGAAVSSQTPKLHITANEDPKSGFPGSPAIIQKAWAMTWTNGAFKREMRGAWQKRKICGLGCIWYRWDKDYGFCVENVTSNRFFFDPHATNMRRLRYGGVSINMPLSVAMERYDPKGEEGFFSTDTTDGYSGPPEGMFRRALNSFKQTFGLPIEDQMAGASKERTTCKIYIYFDSENEVHVYNDMVVHRTKNLYGMVPLHFRGLFIDPRDRILPLGMNVFARGLNQWLVWLAAICANTAKNGATITFFDTNKIKGPERTALENGSASQCIGVGGINSQSPPAWRLPADQLSPAWGPARTEVQAALDGIMGSSSAQRGETPPGVTATAAMLAESKANAIQVDEQMEFEDWCTDIARAFVMCTQRFGGPEDGKSTPDEAKIIWQAFLSVHDVKVVSGSTSFSNPATELQASMQLYTTVTQSWELWQQLAARGLVKQVPKLDAIYNDLLIAFNRTNIEEYWMPAPPPPQGPGALPVDVVRWMSQNYQKAPADIQRQIEQAMALKPSEMPPQQEQEKPDYSLHALVLEHEMEKEKLHAKALEQQSDHVHDARMTALEATKEIAVASAKSQLEPKDAEKKPPNSRNNGKS